jgi:hypothetical protein
VLLAVHSEWPFEVDLPNSSGVLALKNLQRLCLDG